MGNNMKNLQEIIVPIRLDALRVNIYGNQSLYTDISRNCRAINYTVLGSLMESPPFSKLTVPPLKPGVHLHWTMPDALTHGTEQENREIVFPELPNRWVVTRFLWDGEKCVEKTWRIYSDVITRNRTAENADSPTILVAAKDCQKSKWYYLGYATDKEETPPAETLENFTAVEMSDPTFHACHPSLMNVFSFRDPLEGIKEGKLSYSVEGWYEESKSDILADVTGTVQLEELGWKTGFPIAEGSSLMSVYHGTVEDVEWLGAEFLYPDGVPQESIKVAAALSPSELTGASLAEEEAAQKAISVVFSRQTRQWGERDGILNIEERLHEESFESVAPSLHTAVRRAEALDSTAPEPILRPEVAEALKAVRLAEEKYSRNAAIYGQLRQELYDCWTYCQLAGYTEAMNNRIQELLSEISKQKEETLPALAKEIIQKKELLKGTDLECHETPGQRFWYPNPPIIMCYGNGIRRSQNFGCDGRFEEDSRLRCRTINQIITSVRLPGLSLTDGIQVSAFQLAGEENHVRSNKQTSQPDCIRKLQEEALLLSPNAIPLLVNAACRLKKETDPQYLLPLLQKRMKLPLLPYQYKELRGKNISWEHAAGMDGEYPSPVSQNPGVIPWIPLYLEWKVSYTPDAALRGPLPTLKNWRLENGEYQWCGPADDLLVPEIFTGRIVISHQTTANLTASINTLGQDWQSLARDAEDRQALSQKLSGFLQQITSHDFAFQLPIMTPSHEEKEIDTTKIAEAVGELSGLSLRPDFSCFHPLLGGLLRIEEVQLVDAFGRAQHTDRPIVSIPAHLQTEVSGWEDAMQLPPRFLQPSRLHFRWNCQNLGSISSPILGWAAVDYTDGKLILYNGSGIPVIFLLPMPDGSVLQSLPPGGRQDFLDQPMRELVSELDRAGAGALNDLLLLMDEKQEQMNRQNNIDRSPFHNFIGNPMAFAAAELSFQFQGKPIAPAISDDFGAEGLCFPAYLGDSRRGDDGLAGYFVRDEENPMSHVYACAFQPKTEDGSGYVRRDSMLELRCDPEAEPRKLLLLLDPTAGIHITSGMLPQKTVELSKEWINTLLPELTFFMKTAPVLTGQDTDFKTAIPVQEMPGFSWKWMTLKQSQWVAESQLVPPQSDRFLEQPQLFDGWLSLEAVKEENSDDEYESQP